MADNLIPASGRPVPSAGRNGMAFAFMQEPEPAASLSRPYRPGPASRTAPTKSDIWFERDSTPRFILDRAGRIVQANAEGRALMARGIVGAGGMLICSAHRDYPSLDEAVQQVSQGRQPTARVPVRSQDDTWCLIELLGAHEFDGQVAASIRRTTELTTDKIEPLRAVFGLTPVESQVLMQIVMGKAPKEVARILSMSIFTVRAHLRTIFVKMGVHGITGTLRLTLPLAL